MVDTLTRAQRSALMSRVRSAGNVSTELRLIAVFRDLGVTGWRRGINVTFMSGEKPFKVSPDFVFRSRRMAVFVDGCFWHGCPRHAVQPKTRVRFWRDKIAGNRARDRRVTRVLQTHGWRVLRVWEHELAPKHANRLANRLRRVGLTGLKRSPA